MTYAKGQTKIAPTEAEPPHPFNIIDTAERRLVEGCVAVFVLGGVETLIPLDTHKPWNTAKGMLPADMCGGDYEVSVRQPGGAEFLVGMFKVLAPSVVPTNPTAADDAYITNEDATLNIPAPGVLGNDVDPEGDPLTAMAVTSPSHGTVTLNSDGSFTYNPADNYNGPDSFTYKASDGALDSNVASVSITVNPVNDAPTVENPIPDHVKLENEVYSYALGNTFNDVDAGDSLTYTATLVSGDQLPSFLTLDAGTATLHCSPDYASAGVYDVRIITTDQSGASTADTFTITVTNTNRVPELVVAPDQSLYTVDEKPAAALIITVSFSDPDGDTVTVQVSQLPAFVTASPTFPGTTSPVTLTVDPGCNDVGVYSIVLTATDDDPVDPKSASKTLMIQVTQTNCPGTLALSADNPPLTMDENSDVNYKLALTDPEGDGIASVAIVSQQPDDALAATAVKIGGDWYISVTADCNDAKQQATQDYTITVQATDTGLPSGALSNQLPVTVTVVNINCPPVLNTISDWMVDEGDVLEFIVSAIDPDLEDTTLWFLAYDLPSGATFDQHNRRFVWMPGYDQAGTYTIEFVVYDRDPASGLGGLCDIEDVTITVNDVAHAHMLTVNIVGNGGVILDPLGGVYDEGVMVGLTASADPGWSFSGWSGDLSGYTNPESITMDSDKTLTATFTENQYITPTSGPVGTPFTIYDPQGRMQPGDICLFYPDGGDAQTGTPAVGEVITEFMGTWSVPLIAPGQYAITIRAAPNQPSRFEDLLFYVLL